MPAHPEQSESRSELLKILTPEEREYHLNYAQQQAIRHYSYRLQNLGASREEIAHKVATTDWTMSEQKKEEVLMAAAYRKKWAQEEADAQEAKRREQVQRWEKLRSEWNAEAFLRVIREHYSAKHGQVIEVAGQDRYFRALAYMLAGDARLETELGMSHQRGLLVLGESGLGKTETLRAVQNNPLAPLQIGSMLTIAEQVRERGSCIFSMDRITVLDDVGNEPVPVKHYGTEINWFKDFIELTYLRQRTFNNLIITTNLGGQQIQELYGYRVRSRLRDMMNVVTLTGEDLRK